MSLIRSPELAPEGEERINWVARHMPVLQELERTLAPPAALPGVKDSYLPAPGGQNRLPGQSFAALRRRGCHYRQQPPFHPGCRGRRPGRFRHRGFRLARSHRGRILGTPAPDRRHGAPPGYRRRRRPDHPAAPGVPGASGGNSRGGRGDHHGPAAPARPGPGRAAGLSRHRRQRRPLQVPLRQPLRYPGSPSGTASCGPPTCLSPERWWW